MNRFRILAAAAALVFGVVGAFAQGSTITPGSLSKAQADSMVAKFTANESAFREALTNYVFNRSATVQTIGMGGQITGTYRRDLFMTFA